MPRFLGQKKLRIDDENADESDDTLTMFNSVTAQEVNLILLIILKISNLEKNLFFSCFPGTPNWHHFSWQNYKSAN